MRTLSIPSFKLMLALSVAPAMVLVNTGCGGGGEKPAEGDDDDDDDTVGDDDDDGGPVGDDDDDDDTTGVDSGTDSYYYGYLDTAVLWGAYNGEGTVNLKEGTYSGTYGAYIAVPSAGLFCDVVWTAEDLASSTVVTDSPSDIDFTTCFQDDTACDFAFDHAYHTATVTKDCAAFGIDVAKIGNGAFPIGFIDNYNVAGTTSGGKTFDYDLDLLMYYVDYQAYVGWYASYFGIVAPYYYGGLEMSWDPATGAAQFTDYAYYSIIYAP
jgi:hypothetical protein